MIYHECDTIFFFFNDTATTEIYTLSLHDALPICFSSNAEFVKSRTNGPTAKSFNTNFAALYDRIGEARWTPSNLWCGDERSEEHTSELQSRQYLVCRLLLEKKKKHLIFNQQVHLL